jgi:catechol 2,3-dioxygenase-like lactoylglutathione lyase family enzyme
VGSDVKHLHLSSRDHAASQRFYEIYVGFHFDSVFARGPGIDATIIRSPTGFQIYLEAGSTDALPAWFHFGFFVESAAAVRELHARMVAAGVTIVHPLVEAPFTNFFFADPDGHVAQIYFDPKAQP